MLEGWTPLPGGRGVGWDQAGCAGTRSSHRLQNLQRGRGRAWQHRGPPEPTVSEQEQHPGERAQASGQELRLERIEMVQGGSVLALGWFALAWPLLARRWRFAPRAAGLVSVHTGGGDGSAQDSCRGSDPADGWGEYFQFPQKLIFIDIFHPLKGFFSIFNIEGLFTESQNHRIVGVGRELCGSSIPTPLPKQGHLQQAAEDLVQVGLEYLQRRRLHSLPGQPGPGLRHPQREEVPPHVQMELAVPQFVPIAPCPVTGHH